MGLPVIVIGILPQYHHFHPGKRRQGKGRKQIPAFGKYLIMPVFIIDLVIELPVIALPEFRLKGREPVIVDSHIMLSSAAILQ